MMVIELVHVLHVVIHFGNMVKLMYAIVCYCMYCISGEDFKDYDIDGE